MDSKLILLLIFIIIKITSRNMSLYTVTNSPILFKSQTRLQTRYRPNITTTLSVCYPNSNNTCYVGKGFNTFNNERTPCTFLIIPVSPTEYNILKIDLTHGICMFYYTQLQLSNDISCVYSIKGHQVGNDSRNISGKCSITLLTSYENLQNI